MSLYNGRYELVVDASHQMGTCIYWHRFAGAYYPTALFFPMANPAYGLFTVDVSVEPKRDWWRQRHTRIYAYTWV